MTDTAVVALVGNPNVGKTTLFNRLTGARQSVMNAPGTTVDVASGTWSAAGAQLRDLPGAYSLIARSPDEEATAAALADADLAIVLVDATALARSLYLVGQVGLTGTPTVVALTMQDVAEARGVAVDLAMLQDRLGVPVVGADPRTGDGQDRLALAVRSALVDRPHLNLPTELHTPSHPLGQVDSRFDAAEALFEWVADVQSAIGATHVPHKPSRSDRIDSWMLRPWVGGPVFLAVLWAVFQLSTVAAAPLMNGAEWLVTTGIGGPLRTWFTEIHAPIWLTGFLVDGVLTGIATVASFLPLMAIMFLVVGMLEDSGYLARAAFVADRAMRPLGLDGRAVLPLVIGFGCNVSAMAALRTLPNARQRVLAALLVPFTSCTARLAVYVMLAAVFFPQAAGAAVLGMYALSAGLVVAIGMLLRRTAFTDLRREPLIIAMPAYQRPRIQSLLVSTGSRSKAFVTGAGSVIVATLAAVWIAMAIPVHGSYPVGQVPVQDSAYGVAAQAVAPVFTPAGFGDWGAASALATGIIAKEVVVGSLQQAYGEDGQPWATGIRDAFNRTSGGHGSAAAFAFLVFTLVYTPCLATVAELRRQVGSRWTTVSVVGSSLLAWVLAVVVFQVGRLL